MFSVSFGRVEAQLPDDGVDVAAGVVAELDLAGLVLADDLADVGRDRAGPRRGHQPARAEHLAQRADDAHHVRRGDADVEVGPAALDLLRQLRAADLVRAGRLGLVDLVALGEHHRPQHPPIPCGSTIEPRTNWSACFGSIPSRMTISTVWSNFVVLKVFNSDTASANGRGVRSSWTFSSRALIRLDCLTIVPSFSVNPMQGPPLPPGEGWGEGIRRRTSLSRFRVFSAPHPGPLPEGEGDYTTLFPRFNRSLPVPCSGRSPRPSAWRGRCRGR